MTPILSPDDRSELLMAALQVELGDPGPTALLWMKIDYIFIDKLTQVLELIEKQKQTRPMNGDGHNYSLDLAIKAIKREFDL